MCNNLYTKQTIKICIFAPPRIQQTNKPVNLSRMSNFSPYDVISKRGDSRPGVGEDYVPSTRGSGAPLRSHQGRGALGSGPLRSQQGGAPRVNLPRSDYCSHYDVLLKRGDTRPGVGEDYVHEGDRFSDSAPTSEEIAKACGVFMRALSVTHQGGGRGNNTPSPRARQGGAPSTHQGGGRGGAPAPRAHQGGGRGGTPSTHQGGGAPAPRAHQGGGAPRARQGNEPNVRPRPLPPVCDEVIEVLDKGKLTPDKFITQKFETNTAKTRLPRENSGEYWFQVRGTTLEVVNSAAIPEGYTRIATQEKQTDGGIYYIKVVLKRVVVQSGPEEGGSLNLGGGAVSK